MSLTLYTGIENMQYVVLASNGCAVKKWCIKWRIDPDTITSYEVYCYQKSNIEVPESFSLVLLEGWQGLKEMDPDFVKYLCERAVNIHYCDVMYPYALAGHIVNWKKTRANHMPAMVERIE